MIEPRRVDDVALAHRLLDGAPASDNVNSEDRGDRELENDMWAIIDGKAELSDGGLE